MVDLINQSDLDTGMTLSLSLDCNEILNSHGALILYSYFAFTAQEKYPHSCDIPLGVMLMRSYPQHLY